MAHAWEMRHAIVCVAPNIGCCNGCRSSPQGTPSATLPCPSLGAAAGRCRIGQRRDQGPHSHAYTSRPCHLCMPLPRRRCWPLSKRPAPPSRPPSSCLRTTTPLWRGASTNSAGRPRRRGRQVGAPPPPPPPVHAMLDACRGAPRCLEGMCCACRAVGCASLSPLPQACSCPTSRSRKRPRFGRWRSSTEWSWCC